MKKALKVALGAGIVLGAGKWLYDECVARYQMWGDALLCEGFRAALEGIRGESGQYVAISVERLRELEELEVMHQEMAADDMYAQEQYEKWKVEQSSVGGANA